MALQSFAYLQIRNWDEWEVRVLVLLSLFVQIILIIFGSQRKYTRRITINLLVWLAYLPADVVATVALSVLARSRRYDAVYEGLKLQAFWAPFLLLHLGGPDTITAYSLADNELWLRQFLQFVFQVGVAFYVFIPSWGNKDAFRFIAIPVFVAEIIKYAERILVLYSSSSKQFKESLRSPPDYSHDHKKKEGSEKKSTDPSNLEAKDEEYGPTEEVNNYLIEAVSLFKKFRCLYADLILDHDERKESYSLLRKKSAKEAFKLVAVELGFLYDVLYTKTTTIYSVFGIFLRCICLFSHIFVSVAFLITIDKSSYSLVDISVTYLLLVGTIFIEVYAFIVILFSDWTKYWLTKRNYMSIDTCSIGLLSNDNRRWSGSMGQYNLLSFSLLEHQLVKSSRVFNTQAFGIKGLVEKYNSLRRKDVDDRPLDMIFKQFLEKSEEIKEDFDNKKLKELLDRRGDYVLSKRNCVNEFLGSTIEVEFDYSLLLWHVTTDLCYYNDICNLKEGHELPLECEISKRLSDYMLYLLVICPTMLPKGIGEIRYKDTCLEAMRFFRNKKFRSSTGKKTACKAFLEEFDQNNCNCSLSVLFHGCKLAKQLQDLNILGDDSGRNYKWKIMLGPTTVFLMEAT